MTIVFVAARKGPVHPGLLKVMLLPILYGLGGFVVTAIFCWLYNAVAKRLGGIEIDLSSEP
jgi:hypothetical protein